MDGIRKQLLIPANTALPLGDILGVLTAIPIVVTAPAEQQQRLEALLQMSLSEVQQLETVTDLDGELVHIRNGERVPIEEDQAMLAEEDGPPVICQQPRSPMFTPPVQPPLQVSVAMNIVQLFMHYRSEKGADLDDDPDAWKNKRQPLVFTEHETMLYRAALARVTCWLESSNDGGKQ